MGPLDEFTSCEDSQEYPHSASGAIPMCMGSIMFLHKKIKIFQSTSNTTLNNSTIKMSAEVKHMSQYERHHLRACSEKAPIRSGVLLSDNKEDAK